MTRTDTSTAATVALVYPAGIAAAAFEPAFASMPCFGREEIAGPFSAIDDEPIFIEAERGMALRAVDGLMHASHKTGASLREIVTGEEFVSERNEIVRIRTRRCTQLHVTWPSASSSRFI